MQRNNVPQWRNFNMSHLFLVKKKDSQHNEQLILFAALLVPCITKRLNQHRVLGKWVLIVTCRVSYQTAEMLNLMNLQIKSSICWILFQWNFQSTRAHNEPIFQRKQEFHNIMFLYFTYEQVLVLACMTWSF